MTTFLGVQFIQLFFAPDLGFVWRYQVAQWTAGLPGTAAEWRFVGELVALYLGLLFVHGLGAWVDLEGLWRRTPWWLRAAAVGGALLAASTLRVAEPLDFVYFRF